MIPFGLAVQLLGLSSLTGTRSALTILLCLIASALGLVTLPPDMELGGSIWGIALFAGLAVVEEILEREHDFADLLAVLRYGTSGTAGFAVAWGLAASAAAAGHPAPPPWLAGAIGVLVSMATFHLRRHVHAKLHAVTAGLRHPRAWLSRLEVGATFGVAGAVLLAPFLGLAFVALAAVLSAGLLILGRALEARRRRRCPDCGFRARKEASVCASCRAPLAVEERLEGGWRLAI